MENWEAMDLADLNIAYNARESVPDFDIYARGFTSDSERVRAALAVEASVPYGPHRDQVLDVFPAGGKSGPAGDGLGPEAGHEPLAVARLAHREHREHPDPCVAPAQGRPVVQEHVV